MRIAVLDDYQSVASRMADWGQLGASVDFLNKHIRDESELARLLLPYNAVVLMRGRTALPRSVIEKLTNLKLIVRIGHNAAIDLAAATERGIVVCGTRVITTPTVELTWALLLELCRKTSHENAAIRQGRWQTTVGVDLSGRTLGILGLGQIGKKVAEIAQVFGMKVVAWSPGLTEERALASKVTLLSRKAFFETSDLITIHIVLSDRTRGLIGLDDLGSMKKSAFLINTSRAPIVQPQALLQVLRQKRIAGAAIDVFEREPVESENPLLQLDNVILTPHLGYVTEDNYRLGYGDAVEDILAYMSGHPIRRITLQHDPY